LTLFKIAALASPIAEPDEVNFQARAVDPATYLEAPEVFLFPGLGGDDRELAALRLGCAPKLQCIPIQFPYWTDHARSLTLDQLIDHCCAQIELQAPTGKLRLAGYSFGGTIAHAVAEALTAAGRRVDRLVLVDAPSSSHVSTPVSPQGRWRRWTAAVRDRHVAPELARTIVGVVTRLRQPRLLIALGRLGRFKLPFDMEEHLNGQVTCRLRGRLLQDLIELMLVPRPRLDVPAVLFRSTQQLQSDAAHDLGWSRHLSSLQIINLPGDHHSVIKPENIAMLCNAFTRAVVD
jgi:thioesterase domain-containing protein